MIERLRWLLLACLSVSAACSPHAASFAASPHAAPPAAQQGEPNAAPPERQPARTARPAAARSAGQRGAEFRGAWIATVDNIDFPSRPGLSPAQLRGELDAIVARAQQLGLNALIFQVRPAADAFYQSPLEPWSEWLTGRQGRPPAERFDPLHYLIARCHQHGLQLHAWFNPFRCRHRASKSPPHEDHVSVRAPKLVVDYGKQQWMDPGNPTARKWSLAVIQDVVRRYDIDGVHLDDYFYPYPENERPFADDASYAAYQRGGGGLARADWRRASIDTFVEQLYRVVHADKPSVMVGISPFGIARPGVPNGIKAGLDQYADLHADVPKWLRNGWLDYLAPQLYWPINQRAQAFDVLLDYWHRQNVKGRAIWPGLYTTKIRGGSKLMRARELSDEITLTRKAADTLPGHIHFSFKALRDDHPAVARQLRTDAYRSPAPVPRLPWLPARSTGR